MIIHPEDVPEYTTTVYPEPFKNVVAGRIKQRLGSFAGLKNFGVNLTKLAPGSASALRHWHSSQDEFIYVLTGEITLITDEGEQILTPGMAAAFPAGEANGHHLVNRSGAVATYLEIGDKTPGDIATYPDDDLMAIENSGSWVLTRKNGQPYANESK
ncbi:cupin domain-containing protein [Calothrix sp. 336/3]|uniref:cupin domain-containing protein n=1 Tax=Calothrix sp. 336/3 TaxID=1337936 RepID=UPI0004E37F51|nr:cupin domain-containing protein [Calothrix sp. 336/3]AKG24281.1 cupin [Calothrix sp. 336/3]